MGRHLMEMVNAQASKGMPSDIYFGMGFEKWIKQASKSKCLYMLIETCRSGTPAPPKDKILKKIASVPKNERSEIVASLINKWMNREASLMEDKCAEKIKMELEEKNNKEIKQNEINQLYAVNSKLQSYRSLI